MGVNRFMSPTKTRYFQTYVSQFVPLPFEIMQRKAEREQKHFDTVRDNWGVIASKMGEDVLQEDMNPLMNNVVTDLQSRINQGLDEYDGDWRKLDNMVRNVGNEYQKFKTSGEGALAIQSKLNYDTHTANITDSNMSGEDKNLWNRYVRDRYQSAGAALGGNVLEGFEAYNSVDWQQEALDAVTKLKGNKTSFSTSGYDDNGRLLVDYHGDDLGVSRDRVRQAVRSRVWGNQDFNDMVNKKYEVYGFYNPEVRGMTREQFKEALFNDMLGVRQDGTSDFDEFAFNQHTERRKAKETKYGQLSSQQRFDIENQPLMSYQVNFNFENDARYNKIASSPEPTYAFMENYEQLGQDFLGTSGGANSPLFQIYQKSNPGMGLSEFNAFQNAIARDLGLNLNEQYGRRKYLEYMRDGQLHKYFRGDENQRLISEGLLDSNRSGANIGTTAAAWDNLAKQARNELKLFSDMDDANFSIVRDAADRGIITKAQFDEFRKHMNNLEELQTKIDRGEIEEENVDKYQRYIDLQKRMNKFTPEGMQYQVMGDDVYLMGQDTSFHIGKASDLSALHGVDLTADGTPHIEGVFDFWNESEFQDFANRELKARFGSDRSLTIRGQNTFATDLYMPNEREQFNARELNHNLRKELAQNPGLYEDIMVRTADGDGAPQPLNKLIMAKVEKRLGPDATGPQINSAYQVELKKALSGAMFSNSVNPINGSEMLILGGQYLTDLSAQPGNIDILQLKTLPSADTRAAWEVNGMINNAIRRGSGIERVTDDGAIRIVAVTPDMNKGMVDGQYILKQNSDGTAFHVEIDPKKLGIADNRGGDLRMLPATVGRQLLLDIKKAEKNVQYINGRKVIQLRSNETTGTGDPLYQTVPYEEWLKRKVQAATTNQFESQ